MNKRFEEFLDKNASNEGLPEFNPSNRIEEYKQAVNSFFLEIDSFLTKYKATGKIRIEFGMKSLSEDLLGTYEVKNAKIEIGQISLSIEPIGAIVVGARGRIDILSADRRIMCLLVPESALQPSITVIRYVQGQEPPASPCVEADNNLTWKIATKPPIRFMALSEDSFLDAIMEISNV